MVFPRGFFYGLWRDPERAEDGGRRAVRAAQGQYVRVGLFQAVAGR
jgi:hypothetical protein